MTDQINSGLLIMGVSSTVLFDGETSTTELILLNLATGMDFSLPVSDEQAAMLFAHLTTEEELVEVPAPPPNGSSPIPMERKVDKESATAFAETLGLGGSSDEGDSSRDAEETPQF